MRTKLFMDSLAYRLILLILILPLLISCGQEQESNRQVDQSYLDSQEYSEFNEKAARESEMKAKKNASMQERLQRFAECAVSDQMQIPFEVDNQEVMAAAEKTTESCSVENELQSLKLLGESRLQNQTIRWIVLERQSAYRDQELLVSTYRDSELRSFNTVGIFKKNPSEEISTEIEVRNKGNTLYVISRTTRNIIYPIEQENVVTAEYQINADGSIREL